MPNVQQIKHKMRNYLSEKGLLEGISMNVDNAVWGVGSRRAAWRLTENATGKPSTRKAAVVKVLFPVPSYYIKHDYHAVHSSGVVPASRKTLIVIHDMEVDSPTGAAESVGNYFEMQSSGGSTQFGIDNDSIQQYLPTNVIPWGAPYANTQGIHIEQMGKAGWSTDKWESYAAGTIDRCAWLVAKLSREYNIPIRLLTPAQVKAGMKGVATHAICTKAFNVYGGHTDPGPNYPIGQMLKKAREYK